MIALQDNKLIYLVSMLLLLCSLLLANALHCDHRACHASLQHVRAGLTSVSLEP